MKSNANANSADRAHARRGAFAFVQPLRDVVLDARRVAFFPEHDLLAAADLHLGYAWCHRASGQLMPISAPDDTLARLRSLVTEFKAKRLVLLGDIVHRAVAVAPLLEQLSELAKLKEETELVLLAGNHDRRFARIGTGLALRQEYRAGENLFLHGDRLPSRLHERCVIGHEHPGISLGDGVATSRRYPCFLIAENLLVLPAFSNWSANGSVPRGESMSPLARKAEIAEAIAILDGKLLRVPLPC